MHSNQPILWARFGPAHIFGPDPAHFKEKNKKYLFQHIIIFPRNFYVILINIWLYFFYVVKNTKIWFLNTWFSSKKKSSIKYKKIKKREKNVFVHTAKCLKAKNSYCIFFIHQKKIYILACILALITSLLKSREYWPKFQKTTKILFCLSLSIRGMTLHVMHIPDI